MRTLANSVLARVEKQRELMETLTTETNAIKVRVSSPDKLVTVEVDGVGAMTGLWLAPGIDKHSATGLSALIVETAQHAARVSLERRNQLLAQFTERFDEQRNKPLERWDGTTVTPTRPDPAGTPKPAAGAERGTGDSPDTLE